MAKKLSEKSSASPPTVTSQEGGITTSLHKIMKNTCTTAVLNYQSSTTLQGKDIVNLLPKVAKQGQSLINGLLFYNKNTTYNLSNFDWLRSILAKNNS